MKTKALLFSVLMMAFCLNTKAQLWSLKGGAGYSYFDEGVQFQIGLERQTASRFSFEILERFIPTSFAISHQSPWEARQFHFNIGWNSQLQRLSFKNYFGCMYRNSNIKPPGLDHAGAYESKTSGLISGLEIKLNLGRFSPMMNLEYAIFGGTAQWFDFAKWKTLNNGVSISAGLAYLLN